MEHEPLALEFERFLERWICSGVDLRVEIGNSFLDGIMIFLEKQKYRLNRLEDLPLHPIAILHKVENIFVLRILEELSELHSITCCVSSDFPEEFSGFVDFPEEILFPFILPGIGEESNRILLLLFELSRTLIDSRK